MWLLVLSLKSPLEEVEEEPSTGSKLLFPAEPEQDLVAK